MKVHYTRPAAADVVAILDHLEAQSPQGARRVRERLRDIEQILTQFPNDGQPTRFTWLRRLAVQPCPYLVFYEATAADIIIHAVWHAARNLSDRPCRAQPPVVFACESGPRQAYAMFGALGSRFD